MYQYELKEIVKIYDADTITVVVDLGFGVTKEEVFRLMFINAPEVKGIEKEAGIVSRDWLRTKLYTAVEDGLDITINSFRDTKEKYGRYLAEIFIEGEQVSINQQLVDAGLAVLKEY